MANLNKMKFGITSVGHKILNFSLYPRFPEELDPDVKRRLSIENYFGSYPKNIPTFPRFS